MDVVLHPAMQERYHIVPISVLSQSTLLRFMISFISHFSTRLIRPLHAQVVLPIPLMLLLDRLRSPPLCSGVLPPLAAHHLLALSTWLPPPSSTRFTHLNSLYSLRSLHANQTAVPGPNLPNDETKSRPTYIRIW
jgi:hypothetical protein